MRHMSRNIISGQKGARLHNGMSQTGGHEDLSQTRGHEDLSQDKRTRGSESDRRTRGSESDRRTLTGLCQHEIVSGILKKLKQCGTVQASYGCLVGNVSEYGRPYLSCCPITLQHFSFRS